MRCSGWSSLAISACSALEILVLAGSASAHVIAMPGYIPSKGSEAIILEVPNERPDPMTSFVVNVPSGIGIEHAHPADGWSESVEGSTARWTGGALPAHAQVDFRLTLKAGVEPGAVALDAEQIYGDGSVVTWRVSITITPPTESPSQNLALAGVVGLIGVLVVAAVTMLAMRRRSPPVHDDD
jgi:uncharacterized protein YcnI